MRVHAVVKLESNGERLRIERSWTVKCRCGFEEYASTKAEAMHEYRAHKMRMR